MYGERILLLASLTALFGCPASQSGVHLVATIEGEGSLVIAVDELPGVIEMVSDGREASCTSPEFSCACVGTACEVGPTTLQRAGVVATISAEAAPGWEVAGLSCDGCRQLDGLRFECAYGELAHASCSVTFTSAPMLEIDPVPINGAIFSEESNANLVCPGTCSTRIEDGESYVLVAVPDEGYRVGGFTGACADLTREDRGPTSRVTLTPSGPLTVCSVEFEPVNSAALSIVATATPFEVMMAGDPVQLSALVENGVPPFNFRWTAIDIIIAHADPAQPDASAQIRGQSMFTVTVTDSTGATASDDITVDVARNMGPMMTVQLCSTVNPCLTPFTHGAGAQTEINFYARTADPAEMRSPAEAFGAEMYQWTIRDDFTNAVIVSRAFSDTAGGVDGPLAMGERLIMCGRLVPPSSCVNSEAWTWILSPMGRYRVEARAFRSDGAESDTAIFSFAQE